MIDWLGDITSESPNSLVRPAYKFVESVTETNSKMCEPLTYDKAVNDSIHGSK